MRKFRLFYLFICLLGCARYCAQPAFAFAAPESPKISQLVEQSDIICIANIVKSDTPIDLNKFDRQEDGTYTFKPGYTKQMGQIDIFLFLQTLKFEGKYELQVERAIKGALPNEPLLLSAPPLLSLAYQSADFSAENGDRVLVFLKDSPLRVADDVLFFIPISASAKVSEHNKDAPAFSVVRELMIDSLSEPKIVSPLLFLLRDQSDERIVLAAASLSNSKNGMSRITALKNLVANQQVGAISMILKEARDPKNPFRSHAAQLLSSYKSKTAVPFLNPLLFDSNPNIRSNSLSALYPLADVSTVPYSILFVPTRDQSRSQSAQILQIWGKILKGDPLSFLVLGESEKYNRGFEGIMTWWQDELSGKHPTAENEQPAVELRAGQTFEDKDVPILNRALFQRGLFTRRVASEALEKWGDQSSIPYLILALYDPDGDVAFSAYKTLHRLIPEFSAMKTRATFEAQKESYQKEAIEWWQKFLAKADQDAAAPSLPAK